MKQVDYFDTTTTDDLTDAKIQAAIDKIGGTWSIHNVRGWHRELLPKAIIALARLMRDHPELFEEPVDPLESLIGRWKSVTRYCSAAQGGVDKQLADDTIAALDLLRSAKSTEPEWIDWHGGECPVPAGSDCELRFRNGYTELVHRPETWFWGRTRGKIKDAEIVAYRVWP